MKQGIYLLTCCLRAKKLKEKGPQEEREETTRSGFIVEGQRARAGGIYKLTLNLLKLDKELWKATRTRPMGNRSAVFFPREKKKRKKQNIGPCVC
jgi:hypothetical protein